MKQLTPFQLSALAWIGGGITGAALSKDRRVTGAALGALLIGAISDKLIERYHPMYSGPRTVEDYRLVCAALNASR